MLERSCISLCNQASPLEGGFVCGEFGVKQLGAKESGDLQVGPQLRGDRVQCPFGVQRTAHLRGEERQEVCLQGN